jgi:hypothetical protein
MPEDVFKIKIDGPGLTLDRDVPKELANRVLVLLLTGVEPAGAMPAPRAGAAAGGSPAAEAAAAHGSVAPSLREFLVTCTPKRGPDKITAIADYLRQHRQRPFFKTADISQGFEDAAERVPGNLARDMKWTQRAGWIAIRGGSKGEFYVTNTGKEAVTKAFSKEVVAKTKGLFEPKGKSKSKGAE